MQDFLRRSSRVLERALGEKEALDVLLDYGADEGDTSRGDQGQRLNEAMTLHEVWLPSFLTRALLFHPAFVDAGGLLYRSMRWLLASDAVVERNAINSRASVQRHCY